MKELIKELKFWEMSHKLKITDREDLRTVIKKMEKQLTIPVVSQQRELLEWLSSEDYFNIPKDEISEILEDWQTYNSNCG